MPSTTAATAPLSDYEALSTLWAAAYTARGTDLRGKSLVNLDVLSSVPHGFVADLRSKLRPAGIEYGLGQAGAGQSRGIDATDKDAPVLPYQPCGQLLQEVPAAGGILRVDGPHTRFASGTLCDRQCLLVLAVDARGLDHLARGAAAGIAGDRKLLAHRLHGIRMQAQELAAATGELDEIEARGPA